MQGCYGGGRCCCYCCSCGCSQRVQTAVAGVPSSPRQAQEQINRRNDQHRIRKQACCCCSRHGSGQDMDGDDDDDDRVEGGAEQATGRCSSSGEAEIRTSYCTCCRRRQQERRRCDSTRGGEGGRRHPPMMISESDDRARLDPAHKDGSDSILLMRRREQQQQQQLICSMRVVQVRCSVPPDDAASFPRLAVARKLIHTHTSPLISSSSCSSSSLRSSCCNSTHLPCGHGCCRHTSSCVGMDRCLCTSQLPALNWPPQPSLIINHTCPSAASSSSSPPSIRQQILFTDAATTTVFPSSASGGSTFTEVDHDQHASHVQGAAMAASSSCNTSPTASVARVKEEKRGRPLRQNYSEDDQKINSISHQDDTASYNKTPESISHERSINAAAGDGVLLAAELIRHFKEGLIMSNYSSSSSSSSSSAAKHDVARQLQQTDWDAIVASKEFDRFLSTLRNHGAAAPRPPWLADGATFKRAIKGIVNYVAGARYSNYHHRRCCIEDLLHSIEDFERAGLIAEMERLGLDQEARVLRDRVMFFDVLARARVLQEACALLDCIRGWMGLPRGHSWSLAWSNDRCRRCLQQIAAACGSPDDHELKTFAWNLDKVELVAIDTTPPCPQAHKGKNSTSIAMRVEKLFTSPLAPFFGGFCAINHLKSALCLLQHHINVMEVLHTNGFCSVKTLLPNYLRV